MGFGPPAAGAVPPPGGGTGVVFVSFVRNA